MRKILATTILAVALFLTLAIPAFGHAHFIILPDGSCQWLANGVEEPAVSGHPIHTNVHTGAPGTSAMDNTNNPVDIDKDANYASRGCTPHP